MIVLPKRVYERARSVPPDRLPLSVYDLPLIDEHVRRLRADLPPEVELHVALPYVADPDLLAVLGPHVDGFTAQPGSAAAAEPGGVPLTLSGTGKSLAEIAEVAAHKGTCVEVESPEELHLAGHTARAAGRTLDVLLRVDPPLRPGSAAGPAAPSSGMDAASLVACADAVRSGAPTRPVGFSVRLPPGGGGGATAAEHADGLLRALRPWSAMFGIESARYAIVGGTVNVPGGADDGTGFDWAGYGAGLAALARPGETVRVTPEGTPASWAGWLLAQVLDVRHNYGRAVAVVALSERAPGSRQPAVVARDDDVSWGRPWQRPDLRGEPVTLLGKGAHDHVLAHDVPLPSIRPGDIVAFPPGDPG
ncbi:diaminopimelate decarboxylase [Murinocardiopsis flavida]|uniref:Diaminopimelate decarboxylase n=1 Tax=Murinocardiopsis flavida TaxID=645275 RepID=A0A2P8DJI0_9ACTN|nr:hypothetical protein [Murinocardiopsis flavida]PSK97377.1 diaminopimelate decarboxylase [Murinocardiopsis flavida]